MHLGGLDPCAKKNKCTTMQRLSEDQFDKPHSKQFSARNTNCNIKGCIEDSSFGFQKNLGTGKNDKDVYWVGDQYQHWKIRCYYISYS